MPSELTYPGVYIEELPSGVRTITGVATSITALRRLRPRGPVNEPTRVQSFAEFTRMFGGLWRAEHDELRRPAVLPERRPRRADRARRAPDRRQARTRAPASSPSAGPARRR